MLKGIVHKFLKTDKLFTTVSVTAQGTNTQEAKTVIVKRAGKKLASLARHVLFRY